MIQKPENQLQTEFNVDLRREQNSGSVMCLVCGLRPGQARSSWVELGASAIAVRMRFLGAAAAAPAAALIASVITMICMQIMSPASCQNCRI